MPIPSNITGTPVLGFSDPETFFIGYTGSGTYPMRGLGWDMVDAPTFHTLQQKTAAGREVKNALYQNPLHEYKLVFNFLENDPALDISGNPDTDFRMLYSFYLAMTGRYGEFIYKTREATVVKGSLLQPDTNGYVELVYNTGPFFNESVQELNNVTPTVYLTNGTITTDISSTCTFYTADSIPPYAGIVFTTTTPVSGMKKLSWSGTWYKRVHFDKDNYSFSEFMYALYKGGVGLSEARI